MNTTKRFNLSFDCDNAAFEGDIGAEIARILAGVGVEIAGDFTEDPPSGLKGLIRDINGNIVGTWVYDPRAHRGS